MAEISIDMIVTMLNQQHREVEDSLHRQLLDVKFQLIAANERIDILTKKNKELCGEAAPKLDDGEDILPPRLNGREQPQA